MREGILFEGDEMTCRERVEATLRGMPVDRAPLLEQLSYSPDVIADWTGRDVRGFEYTVDDICEAIRRSLDTAMPPQAPRGTARVTTHDGFVIQNDNWTGWHVSRPFTDVEGARDWLRRRTDAIRATSRDPSAERETYRADMLSLQGKIGETVILGFSSTGFCSAFDCMGLELFAYFQADYPEVFADYMEASASREIARVHAVADSELSPVILVPEDFATKHGPIFRPEFLHEFHYPHVKDLVEAWHQHGVKVLYHSDGNWREAVPDLVACGVDGIYCLETNCGLDAVELSREWPGLTFAGSIDGVDLMERGTPRDVGAEVRRQIEGTGVLERGRFFVASSSEINPPIPAANYRAMVEQARATTQVARQTSGGGHGPIRDHA